MSFTSEKIYVTAAPEHKHHSQLSTPLKSKKKLLNNFTLTGSKGQVIGGFQSVLCVSVFQGLLLVIVIMTDGSEKRNCKGGF